ncbi:MAG: TonB-dependent receptor, partial [Sphingobacteriales bacterium]
FSISNIPVGRRTFQFRYPGYEPFTASELLIASGKETELNVAMKESLQQLQEVTVNAGKDRARPQNEFAAVSARSFSVEETRRYAASFADPARMVMNFPGVSNNGDGDNSIVVRGNSPKGVLWRLEGIEIPNPNHFSSPGTSGGAISMLNANVLGSSDFYTAAFPSEIGNALSGAFDLNFREGNSNVTEHTVQVGTLGMELSTEGPFVKGKKASYLVNYRYSTLALLGRFIDLGGAQPAYQDASFKINLPTTKAGNFSLFGLGGYNTVSSNPDADSSHWNDDMPNVVFRGRNGLGVAGISHQYFTGTNSYVRTVLSGSYDFSRADADTLNPGAQYKKDAVEHNHSGNKALRLSVLYNRKISARHTYRTGVIAQHLGYEMEYRYYNLEDKVWKDLLSGSHQTQFYQSYFQWKARLNSRWTVSGGLHASYFALNKAASIEPRFSATYETGRSKYNLAAGLHSKPEHISTYMFSNLAQGSTAVYPNRQLDLLRSFHAVGGYTTSLATSLRLKAEVYFQHLYSIPVEGDSSSRFSIINADDVYDLMATSNPLQSKGTGQNYGVDLSLERPFSEGYYLLGSGSFYRSLYQDFAGRTYNTRFNRGYQLNLIGGKEFPMSREGRRSISLNGKILYSGGLRESLIDEEQSAATGKTVIAGDQYFTSQGTSYFRTDLSISYKSNTKKATHSVILEIQNLTNHRNYYSSYFDVRSGSVKRIDQLGILPNLSYRIDFHR